MNSTKTSFEESLVMLSKKMSCALNCLLQFKSPFATLFLEFGGYQGKIEMNSSQTITGGNSYFNIKHLSVCVYVYMAQYKVPCVPRIYINDL